MAASSTGGAPEAAESKDVACRHVIAAFDYQFVYLCITVKCVYIVNDNFIIVVIWLCIWIYMYISRERERER